MGLIGGMRKVRGDVKFGGKVSYCSQTAWIQNATLVSFRAVSKSYYYHVLKVALSETTFYLDKT
jgi:hypothetical protein